MAKEVKKFIGIDIGSKGFVSVIDEDEDILEQFWLFDNPSNCECTELVNKLMRLAKYEGNCHVVMEDLHALFGASASSTFKLGGLAMATEAVVAALGLPYTKVQAKKWQKDIFQGIHVYKTSSTGKTKLLDTKRCSIMACKRVFPGIDLRRTGKSKNDDDNKADSLCMALYAKRKIG